MRPGEEAAEGVHSQVRKRLKGRLVEEEQPALGAWERLLG